MEVVTLMTRDNATCAARAIHELICSRPTSPTEDEIAETIWAEIERANAFRVTDTASHLMRLVQQKDAALDKFFAVNRPVNERDTETDRLTEEVHDVAKAIVGNPVASFNLVVELALVVEEYELTKEADGSFSQEGPNAYVGEYATARMVRILKQLAGIGERA